MDANTTFPRWMYGPNGESKVITAASLVPAGWDVHPSLVVKGFDPNEGAAIDAASAYAKSIAVKPEDTTGSALGEDANTGGQSLESLGTDDAPEIIPPSEDIDNSGWPWDAARNTEDRGKTANGLWKLKPGQARLPNVPGYPKAPAANLDL